MELAIVGLSSCGKTRLFEALTGAHGASAAKGSQRGALHVPDDRVSRLAEFYRAPKCTSVTIELRDSVSLSAEASSAHYNDRILGDLRDCDGLLVVVRVFRSDVVPHPLTTVDPIRDAVTVLNDLYLSDLGIIEKRLEKLEGVIQKSPKAERETYETEQSVLRQISHAIEEGQEVDVSGRSEADLLTVKGYGLFALKPPIVLANVGDLSEEDQKAAVSRLEDWGKSRGTPVVSINADLEAELQEFPEEERPAYYSEMGLSGSGLASLVKGAFQRMDLLSFLTGGPKEARAWAAPRGITARKAAGLVHTDMEKGFIRADVAPFDDLMRFSSEAEAKKGGAIRSEGKDYAVREGDVLFFHFSR